jgi:serine/threonine protein kinase
LALLQVSEDIENYKSAPQLSYSFEVVDAQFMPSGRPPILRVTDVLTNRVETAIMDIYGMPDKVIKYQANCQALLGLQSQLHPILREYWISQFVERESTKWLQLHNPDHVSLQISPRVFFVSPPAVLPMRKTSKTDFSMDSFFRSQCVAAGSTVRYMIMERTGSNMEDFMSLHNETTNRIEFKLGMKILYQLISRLKVLHSIGVVHGDVHMGNIVRALGGSRDQFLLIDYGLGSFYDPSQPLPEEPSLPVGQFVGTSILTHWEMKGYRRSFRDDILRAMMTVGRIMNGPRYIEIVQNAEGQAGGLESLANYYEKGNLFATPVADGYNPVDDVENLTDEIRTIILKKLGDIRKHGQGISGVNMKPDYDYLLSEIHDIQTLLE